MLEFAVEIIPIIPYIGIVFPFIGSLSLLFLDDFEGNANISVAIKSGSTVIKFWKRHLYGEVLFIVLTTTFSATLSQSSP